MGFALAYESMFLYLPIMYETIILKLEEVDVAKKSLVPFRSMIGLVSSDDTNRKLVIYVGEMVRMYNLDVLVHKRT